jgi:hypothetical protein
MARQEPRLTEAFVGAKLLPSRGVKKMRFLKHALRQEKQQRNS